MRAVRDNPDHYLEQLGVQIDERKLDQFPNSHACFPQELYEQFVKTIGWHIELKPREHDAATTALIMRMRGANFSKDVFKCRFVLVTRNAPFAMAARDVARKKVALPLQAIGPVIHQRQMATAMWLRTGLNTSELPRSYLLATCERLLGLKPNVIEQARIAAARITPQTASQLELLLTEPRSARFLMDKTLGASNVITSSNIELLLEGMQKTLIAEHEEKSRTQLAEERQRAKGNLKKKQDELDSAYAAQQALLSDLEIHKHATRRIVERAVEDANNRIRRNGKFIITIVGGLAVVLVVGPQVGNFLPRYVNWLSTGIGTALGVPLAYLQLWDQPLGTRKWVETHYQRILRQTLLERGILQSMEELGIVFDSGQFKLVTRTPLKLAKQLSCTSSP